MYVEHDIDAELSDVCVADYVLADPTLQGVRLTASFCRTPTCDMQCNAE